MTLASNRRLSSPRFAALSLALPGALSSVLFGVDGLFCGALAAESSGKGPAVKLQGKLDFLSSALHGAGLVLESKTFPSPVVSVRTGSPAYFSGLAANDKVLSCRLEKETLHITFSRNGAIYAARLKTIRPRPDKAAVANPTSSAAPLAAAPAGDPSVITDAEKSVLKRSEFIILLDCSGSMMGVIPDLQTTKWAWCRENIRDFARLTMEQGDTKITLVPFRGDYHLQTNCSPDDVAKYFVQNKPGGETDVSTPLKDVVGRFVGERHGKSLIVAVITDGVPNLGESLDSAVAAITQRIQDPEEVHLVFFCIGKDKEGEDLIQHLDHGPLPGARFDIVDSYSFADLQKLGLSKALLNPRH